MRLRPGALIDSAVVDTTSLIASGAELWPSSIATIATASARVTALRRAQGIDDQQAELVMRSGVAARAQTDQATIVALTGADVVDEAAIAALAAAQAWTAASGAFVMGAGNFDVDVSSVIASSTFPASPAAGEAHMFKVNTAAVHNLTLTRAGAQTIEQTDGSFATTYVFAVDLQVLGFFYETATSRWRIF